MGKLEKYRDYGAFVIRLIFSYHLIRGVIDNIVSWERMEEFAAFLNNFNFPFPIVSAILSVYLQFISAVLVLIGFKTRWVSAVLLIHFLIAILMVHIGDSYQNVFPALVMVVFSLFLLLNGAGKPAVDRN